MKQRNQVGRLASDDEPSTAELLQVGKMLQALAAGGSQTPDVLARVGRWLENFALDELDEVNATTPRVA